jgi:membrane associated rhomboid family serine protease
MGLADRDYARDEPRGIFLGGDRPMYVNLILVNVGIFLVGALFFPGDPRAGQELDGLSRFLSLKADLFTHPWQAWQLLTCGFAHAGVKHILFNMLGLWFFGREVEGIYGRKEFLRIYLSLIVLSAIPWVVATELTAPKDRWSEITLLGASGAVTGVVMLFVFHYPKKTVLLFMVIPAPAWVLGCLMVGSDIYLAIENPEFNGGKVAVSVHLAGAALAAIYYKTGWNLGRLMPGKFSFSRLKPGPKLRLHDPETDQPNLEAEVDRILAKISEQGEASLSSAERKTLERASRRYQQRRR